MHAGTEVSSTFAPAALSASAASVDTARHVGGDAFAEQLADDADA